ncbi:MAG: hypothetical protein CFH37_01529, partial [Alphaproteobacteria bacterium MarineAlpha9_Bin7]
RMDSVILGSALIKISFTVVRYVAHLYYDGLIYLLSHQK